MVPSTNRYWEPAPGLKNPKVAVIEPVTFREPVICADPVNGKDDPPPPLPVLTVIGNVAPSPLVNVIVFEDTDAVVIAFGVKDAVEANEAVPSKEPVNDVDVKEPEMFTVFKAKSPFINGTPEP